MPRTVSGAQRAPARAKVVLTAFVASAALALSACESSGLDSLGGSWFGGGDTSEDETQAATSTNTSGDEAAGGAVETPSGEPGQVIEIISPEADPNAQPPAPTPPPDTAAQQTDTLAAIPPEPTINDDPEQLIGMGPASLNAFLGAPELIRREAPASLWQYRAEGCVLDVVLYPDRQGDKVTYLEARENGATKIPPRTCLNKLLRARFTGSSG
jgi:hypothetical protein